MITLNSATLRRLAKLKRLDSVWEGDRRPLPRKTYAYHESSNLIHLPTPHGEHTHQCILWVDPMEGMVRAMDVVDANAGQEAFVRTLLQAMEHPQGPVPPALPKRIVVCDRQLQFYLRGVLQELDIVVEHADALPLIDSIFANMVEHSHAVPPVVPPAYAFPLLQEAGELWHNAPWEQLWEHQVICLEMHCWDLETLFAVVMGKMGLERGVIFYRSYESLLQFRQRIVNAKDGEILEETFLGQDCLFSLFEPLDSDEDQENRFLQMHGWSLLDEGLRPVFGAVHPLEGGRPYLYDEEAIAMTLALKAFNQFYAQHRTRFAHGEFPPCRGMYRLHSPEGEHQIVVSTMPDLAQELYLLSESDSTEPTSLIHQDLWPDNTLFKLQEIPWHKLEVYRHQCKHCQLAEEDYPSKGAGISALLIQTTRPKALQLIEQISARGGITGITFSHGESYLGDRFELGLLILGNQEIHLFAEFAVEEGAELRRLWKQRCRTLQNNCVVLIAMGVTGATRGKPADRDILGYYEVKLRSAKELGLGILRAEPISDF